MGGVGRGLSMRLPRCSGSCGYYEGQIVCTHMAGDDRECRLPYPHRHLLLCYYGGPAANAWQNIPIAIGAKQPL